MMKSEKGFTLIELLIVVAILGILAVVAVTSYTGVQLKAMRSEAYTNLGALRLVEEQNFADSGAYEGPFANTAAIMADNEMRRFRPGTGLNFNYTVTVTNGLRLPTPVPVPYTGATAGYNDAAGNPMPCFIATATGINGKVAEIPDVFAIDCTNRRNFQ